MGNLLILKAERVKHGMKQADMAKKLGCSTPAYNQKENGKRRFSQDEITTISETLQLSGDSIKDIFFANNINANNKI